MNKIVIAVGGTKGHTVFAKRLAEELKKKNETIKISFIGNNQKSPSDFSCYNIPAGSISLKKPASALKGFYLCSKGFFKSIKYLIKEKPDLVIGFGSYSTFPTLLAANALKIPYFLHEQNSIPGRVNRFFSNRALFTALNMPLANDLLKGKNLHVDIPIDVESVLKERAKEKLSFDVNLAVVLIFGGSQGAEAINKMIFEAKDIPFATVVHLTGSDIWTEKLTRRYRALGIEAIVKNFEENMAAIWQAADLVIARSGAGTISEQLHFEVPAIFIPYPYAKDNHQEINADFAQRCVGGALKVNQSELTAEKLTEMIEKCLTNVVSNRMIENIKNYKTNKNPVNFSSFILEHLN